MTEPRSTELRVRNEIVKGLKLLQEGAIYYASDEFVVDFLYPRVTYLVGCIAQDAMAQVPPDDRDVNLQRALDQKMNELFPPEEN